MEVKTRRVEVFSPLVCEQCKKELVIGERYIDKRRLGVFHVKC